MSGAGESGFEDERDLQAAEYVMGALPPNQARALEALALTDVGVAASVMAWEARLAPLADLLTPVEPPPELWRRLALAAGIEGIAAGPAMPRRVEPARRASAWRSVGLWRATTAVAAATAAVLAFTVYVAPLREAPAPLVAALSPLNAPGATFLVRVGADGQATVIAVGSPDVPQGRSLELWSVAAATPGGAAPAPVSMGLLPASGRTRLVIKLPPGTRLLVSQEPAGGSPTRAPTGPVLYGGELTGT